MLRQGRSRAKLVIYPVAALLLLMRVVAQVPDERFARIVPEILSAAAQNGSLVKFENDSVQGIAGVNRVVVPADGRSLAWGVIRLTDKQGQPISDEVVETSVSEGRLHIIGRNPLTDPAGNLVFAVQAVEGRTVSATVRFYFPRLQAGGQIDLLFYTDYFAPADGCDGIQSASVFYRPVISEGQLEVCFPSQFADMFGMEVDSSPYVPAFDFEATFRATNRPTEAFSEVSFSLYNASCCSPPGQCRRSVCYCDDGIHGYPASSNLLSSYLLPNDDVVAEVEYLVYSPGGGTVCSQEFTYTVRNPILIIEDLEELYLFDHPYESDFRQPARIYISIESPLVRAERGWWWYNSAFYLQVMVRNQPEIIPVTVPTTQPIEVVIPSISSGTVNPIEIKLFRNISLNNQIEVDGTHGYLNLRVDRIYALGRDSVTRTFDFEITYTLSLSRQLSTSRGASSGVVIVRDPANEVIYRYTVPPQKLTLGSHTVVVKIPEDQMLRFGRYVFVPHFIDDLADYYRNRQPKLARVSGTLHFDTPNSPYDIFGSDYLRRLHPYYTIYNISNDLRNNLARQSFPTEGETCFLIAAMSRYLYEPIPQELNGALFVGEDYWRDNGGARRPNPPSNSHIDEFFGALRYRGRIPFFTNNRQAEALGTDWRLWPGPKLEFRWLKLSHVASNEERRLYYWKYQDTSCLSPSYVWRSRVGTHYFAVAVTSPSLDHYVVSGPYVERNQNRIISKQRFERLLRSGQLISRYASDGFTAPLRISSKRSYADVATQEYKRRVIEWASTFVNVRYEWGGCWFGGRAHPSQRDSGGFAGYEGFGIDCSKLVSAAAMMAGLRWDRRNNIRWWDIGGVHFADRYPYTSGWNVARAWAFCSHS